MIGLVKRTSARGKYRSVDRVLAFEIWNVCTYFLYIIRHRIRDDSHSAYKIRQTKTLSTRATPPSFPWVSSGLQSEKCLWVNLNPRPATHAKNNTRIPRPHFCRSSCAWRCSNSSCANKLPRAPWTIKWYICITMYNFNTKNIQQANPPRSSIISSHPHIYVLADRDRLISFRPVRAITARDTVDFFVGVCAYELYGFI